MNRILYTPTKYIQGPGCLKQAGEILKRYKTCFAVLDPGIKETLKGHLTEAFDKKASPDAPELVMAPAQGECCDEEIERLSSLAQKVEADVIIAAGGGKTVDIGKAVGAKLGIATVIAPTIAASDAPTSSISIMYTADHVYKGAVRFPDNPYMILVDTDIIVKAPARFLAAGMGDALATKVEAERCMKAGGKNLHGYTGTLAALQMAVYAYDLILKHGEEAMRDLRAKQTSPAFEAVVEANILMSGLGWENCGLTIPHAFHGAMTPIAKFDGAMHGERVALGVLIQLYYDEDTEELAKLTRFFKSVGLPTSFADIAGGAKITDEELAQATTIITKPGTYAHNIPGGLNSERLTTSMRYFA